MGFWTSKTFLCYAAIAVSISVAIDYWKIYFPGKKQKSIKNDKHTKVFFFSPNQENCQAHGFRMNNVICENPECSVIKLTEIINVIKSAQETLDVCVYFLTHYEIGQAIIDAFNRNVVVRVMTDYTMSKENVERIVQIRKAGVKVRSMQAVENLMHHKFAIVDKTTMIHGSANWTANAFVRNYENVLVTNDPCIVNSFLEEFNRLWLIFDA